MTKKSRRKRKQSPQRKRRDIATTTITPLRFYGAMPKQIVAPTYQPATPVIKEPAPTIVHHPHIGAELHRIGMLASILLATLAVLALVLS